MDVLGVGRRRAPVSGESSATEIVSFLGTHDHHPLSVPAADYFRSLERPRVALFSALVSLYPFRDCVRMWARRSSQLMASIFVVQRWQYKKIHAANGTGQPRVQKSQPLPQPMKTCTLTHGYGFLMGTEG